MIELLAPAKLTLSLRITGVRDDGYHLIDAEMITLSLADTVIVRDDPGPLVMTLDEGVGTTRQVGAGADNLVSRALGLVGRNHGVEVKKRIPPGAGLGGGSADAAAILRWAGYADLEGAARLGADVPFCLVGGRARVEGIGEVVTPMASAPRDLTLFLLPFGVDTRAAYAAWDALDASARVSAYGNDLDAAASAVQPRLDAWRVEIASILGARPRLAGSGSTLFVEGAPATWGLADGDALTLQGEQAAVVGVRSEA